MPQEFSRNSTAYTRKYHLRNVDEPCEDWLYKSPFRQGDIQPLASPSYSDSTTELAYAQIISGLQGLETSYPSWVTYYDLGDSVSAREMGAIMVGDVGNRPIVYADNGIHGNEDRVGRALQDFAEAWITADDPVLNYAREHLTLCIVGTFNPDGQVGGNRNNDNNINLNRQGSHYWLDAPDSDKGANPFDEVEIANILTFLETSNRIGRIIAAVNIHEWESSGEWGILYERAYFTQRSEQTCEGVLHYPDTLASKRDFSGFTINTQKLPYDALSTAFQADEVVTGGNSGETATVKKGVPTSAAGTLIVVNASGAFEDDESLTGDMGGSATVNGTNTDRTPFWEAFRSSRRPYLVQRIRRFGHPDGWAGLIEIPLNENVGVACTMALDFMHGMTAAACDAIQTPIKAMMVLPAISAPLNNNWDMVDWETTEDRPLWMRRNGITNTHFPNGISGDPRTFVRITRPEFSAWPSQRGKAASALVYNQESTDAFFIVGGDTASGPVDSGHKELLPPDGTQSILSGVTLSDTIQHGAMATDNDDLYFAGGHNGSSYIDTVHKTDARNPTSWASWHTLGTALQRHTAHIWNDGADDWLIIVGGRDSTDYRTAVTKVKLSDKTESTVGNLTTKTGYHASAVYNDTLFVFGGYNTTDGVLDAVQKMDLTDGSMTAGTDLPEARRMQAIAVSTDGRYAWLFFGNDGSSSQPDIYRYDMQTDTISAISYERAQVQDDEGNIIQIAVPDMNFGQAYCHPDDDIIYIATGETNAGAFLDTVYEFDTNDLILYQRETVNPREGYMRSSQAFTGYSQGDKFTMNVVCRTGYDWRSGNSYPTTTEDKFPYLRPKIVIGPLSAWDRLPRGGYTVPSFYGVDDFQTFSLPIELQSGENQLRIYALIYGANTHLDLAALQLIKEPFCPVVVPDSGKAEDRLIERFAGEISSFANERRKAEGVISPLFGSQMNVTQALLDFDFEGGSPMTMLRIIYEGSEDFSEPIPVTPSLNAYPPSGNFKLEWIEDGVYGSETFWDGLPLNHNKITRSYRGDQVAWELTSQLNSVTLKLDFYGRVHTKTFNPGAIITGYSAFGTGVTYSASTYTSEACPAGFSELDGENLNAFEVCPDDGSTSTYLGMDRYRKQYAARDSIGVPVFQFSKGVKHLWSFLWSGVSPTFADWLQGFAKLRTFLFLPSVNNPADEYRVRCDENQLQIIERGANRVDVQMTIREYP